MDKEYLEIIKKNNDWFWDIDTPRNLIVTDDLDSILATLLLMQYRPNWHINYFFNFQEGLYVNAFVKDDKLDKVGVDLSATFGNCISNHVVCLRESDKPNRNDINLNYVNKHICLKNYHSKYNLNTLCLVYSLLGLHPQTNKEASLLLLPDSAFQAHYANKEYLDSYIQKKYLCEIMGLPELWELMERHPKKDFIEAQDYWRIKPKFDVTDYGIESVEQVELEKMCEILHINRTLLRELEGLFLLESRSKGYTDLTYKLYDKSKFETFVVISKDKVKFSKRIEE